MDTREVELSRLTVKGHCTLPRRIREFLGVRLGDHVAFVLTEHGVVVKKLSMQADTAPQQSPARALRELVLAIGREAQGRRLSEADVEQDIDRYLEEEPKRQGT